MEKNVLDYVVEKTKELIAAPSCSQEAKEAAQAWLDAVGTEKEAEETKKYIGLIRKINQELGKMADQVTEVVYGIPIKIK